MRSYKIEKRKESEDAFEVTFNAEIYFVQRFFFFSHFRFHLVLFREVREDVVRKARRVLNARGAGSGR